jgi:putative ABC transport system permease protein
MDNIAQQIRFAVRSLIRAPGFAIASALTLALGVGLSTAVFSVADALLLRRLPVSDESRLLLLWGETRDGQFSNFPLDLKDVRAFQRRSRSISNLAFVEFRGATLTPIRAGERVDQVHSSMVSGNFFDVLGSRAVIGRALRSEDDIAGAAPVVILSRRAWHDRFGGDSAIVGKQITMLSTGRPYTVVGVMPQGLDYPRGTDLWLPAIGYGSAGGFVDRLSFDLVARLRPDASAAQASAELTTFFARSDISQLYSVRGVAHTLTEIVLGDTRPAVLVVMLAAALLLFITCVNIANLLLVRALARVKEFVVRSALGASRGRIVLQLLVESAVLSVVGGLLGVGLAVAGVRAFIALAPSGVPRLDEVGVSSAAIVAAFIMTSATMLLSSLAPVFFTSRVNAHDALRSGSRNTSGRRVRTAAEVLVVAQVALAAVSLTTAALVTRSFMKLESADLSFEREHLLVASLTMRADQLGDPRRQRAALDMVVKAAAALPGVQAVSPVLNAPFIGSGGGIDGRLSLPEESKEDATRNPIVNLEVVAPNYFAMLGTPVLRGRSFNEEDREGATSVIVVSSSVAQHFWPNSDPIRKRLTGTGSELTVVGVVPDTRYRELRTRRPAVYFPLRQSPFPIVPSTLLIRTASSSADIVPALRATLAVTQPSVDVVSVYSLETLLEAPRAQPRLNAAILGLFAGAAVFLAAVGLFAVIATMVRQRTGELGIRMALGATPGNVRGMIMMRGLALGAAGAAIGIGGAVATSRLLSALLFEMSPTDAATLVCVTGVIVSVAAIASFFPARSARRIDPIIALRSEG